MPNQPSGLQGLAGINAIAIPASGAFATPEQRSGGTADPYHANVGEQSEPYAWQSQMLPGGSHGPYGPENQMLGDEFWFLEPAGMPEDNPDFDYNTPSLTRSHGSVKNVGLSGPLPSQHDAINQQIDQMGNKASDLNTSRKMQHTRLGDVQNDTWQEIWEVNPGSSDVPDIGPQYSHQANGFGVNDAASNSARKQNLYGYGEKHVHRRFATGHLPGNYMWMQPGGRPLFKTMAGVARPPIGAGSQFQGQDVGAAFAYDTGAVLQNIPSQYTPPPTPNIQQTTASYGDPLGTDSIAIW